MFTVVPINKTLFELHKNNERIGHLNYHEAEGKLYLDYVYVDNEYRNQGLMEHIFQQRRMKVF